MTQEYQYTGCGAQHPAWEGNGKMEIAEAPPHIRSDFIMKVFGILSAMLLLTFAIAMYVRHRVDLQWMSMHYPLVQLVLYFPLLMLLAAMCCRCCTNVNILQVAPWNYIFLLVFAGFQGGAVGFLTSVFTAESVVIALIVTLGLFVTLMAYACITRRDFTGWGPYLLVALVMLILYGLAVSFFSPDRQSLPSQIFSGVGVLLFSFFVIYDVQMIVGNGKHGLSVDDYANGALNLYLDIL